MSKEFNAKGIYIGGEDPKAAQATLLKLLDQVGSTATSVCVGEDGTAEYKSSGNEFKSLKNAHANTYIDLARAAKIRILKASFGLKEIQTDPHYMQLSLTSEFSTDAETPDFGEILKAIINKERLYTHFILVEGLEGKEGHGGMVQIEYYARFGTVDELRDGVAWQLCEAVHPTGVQSTNTDWDIRSIAASA